MHRATLPNDVQVVVKVQRPNAARQIESDLRLMASAARVARERVRQLDFIDTGELVDEFGRSIRLELDYQQEARNAETFRRNFAGDDGSRCRASGGATPPGGCSRSTGSRGPTSATSTSAHGTTPRAASSRTR